MSELTPENRSHYEWMLANLTLNPKHEAWIHNQLGGEL